MPGNVWGLHIRVRDSAILSCEAFPSFAHLLCAVEGNLVYGGDFFTLLDLLRQNEDSVSALAKAPYSSADVIPQCLQVYVHPLSDIRYVTTYSLGKDGRLSFDVVLTRFSSKYADKGSQHAEEGVDNALGEYDYLTPSLKYQLQRQTLSIAEYVELMHGCQVVEMMTEFVMSHKQHLYLLSVTRMRYVESAINDPIAVIERSFRLVTPSQGSTSILSRAKTPANVSLPLSQQQQTSSSSAFSSRPSSALQSRHSSNANTPRPMSARPQLERRDSSGALSQRQRRPMSARTDNVATRKGEVEVAAHSMQRRPSSARAMTSAPSGGGRVSSSSFFDEMPIKRSLEADNTLQRARVSADTVAPEEYSCPNVPSKYAPFSKRRIGLLHAHMLEHQAEHDQMIFMSEDRKHLHMKNIIQEIFDSLADQADSFGNQHGDLLALIKEEYFSTLKIVGKSQ
jgi:hypothetical protein